MTRETQTLRMKHFFEQHAGEKIPCYHFSMNMGILQYCRCVKECRDEHGMEIVNGGDDQTHRWYRYTSTVESA